MHHLIVQKRSRRSILDNSHSISYLSTSRLMREEHAADISIKMIKLKNALISIKRAYQGFRWLICKRKLIHRGCTKRTPWGNFALKLIRPSDSKNHTYWSQNRTIVDINCRLQRLQRLTLFLQSAKPKITGKVSAVEQPIQLRRRRIKAKVMTNSFRATDYCAVLWRREQKTLLI